MKQRERDILLDTLEEDKRRGNFIRIFPSQGSSIYNNYFEATRNSNRFVYQCLYGKLIFNEGAMPDKTYQLAESKKTKQAIVNKSSAGGKSEVVISADDIILEYVRRLIESIKGISIGNFKQVWRKGLLNFINSSMWHEPIDLNQPYLYNPSIRLYKLLQQRFNELRLRREELVMKNNDCRIAQYLETEQKRKKFLLKYSAQELEDLIVTSGKGFALEFAKYFHEFGAGILTQIRGVMTSRSKSQLTRGKQKTNPEEDEEVVKLKKMLQTPSIAKKHMS
eukprot:TRINITY_DN9766_c0_g1_i7.p1 TRINITY_DN9766_c0_g1~~TRINITY_DN9766_c0_g1_i7.p1  ORF type:complete len:279 (-),score=64.37 TRINITY_DN9766_c0_g1_i7:50-886(-)